MKEIDYLTFKKLLHIEDDDHWLGGESPYLYRIAGGAVRAIPWGMKVDLASSEPMRPLVRDLNYNPACFESLNGEFDDLEVYNPSGLPDAALFQFPASVEVVSDFFTRADLWWMVDKELWREYGLPDSIDACKKLDQDTPDVNSHLDESTSAVDPPASEPRRYQYFKRSALIQNLGPYLKQPKKLPGLLSNASKKPDLQKCFSKSKGWNFTCVLGFLLKNNYLKDGVGDAAIKRLID